MDGNHQKLRENSGKMMLKILYEPWNGHAKYQVVPTSLRKWIIIDLFSMPSCIATG